MGLQIEDGTGAGYTAGVNSINRFLTSAVIESADRLQNATGKVWSLYFAVTPVGAGDYFFYLENTGTKILHITDIRISSSVASQISYHYVTGTPSYATTATVTTTNRNTGSAGAPSATIRDDTNITGLTSAGIVFFEECAVADTMYHLRTTSNLRLDVGAKFAMERVAATGLVTCLVSLVEVFE